MQNVSPCTQPWEEPTSCLWAPEGMLSCWDTFHELLKKNCKLIRCSNLIWCLHCTGDILDHKPNYIEQSCLILYLHCRGSHNLFMELMVLSDFCRSSFLPPSPKFPWKTVVHLILFSINFFFSNQSLSPLTSWGNFTPRDTSPYAIFGATFPWRHSGF